MFPSCYGVLAEARSIAFTSLQQRQSIYFSCFGFAISAFQKQSSGVVLWNKFPEAYNFIKKETLAQVFFCEFGQIFKNPFFTEHPQRLLLAFVPIEISYSNAACNTSVAEAWISFVNIFWGVSFFLWWGERFHFHRSFPQNNHFIH